MDRAAGADKVQQGTYMPSSRRRPRRPASARVHQGLHGAGDEPVVHEKILVDVELGILTLQIAGAVAGHAMTQREVLRARRCPDGIGLYEAEDVEGVLQRGRRKEAARDRGAPEIVEGHSGVTSSTAGDDRCV